MHRRQWLGSRLGGSTLARLRAFLQASPATLDGLCATLGHTLGVALLGRTRRASLARMSRASATTTLLGRKLLDRLCGRGGRRGGSLTGSRLRLGLLARLSLWLGVLRRLVLCVLSHVYPFSLLVQLVSWFDVARRALRSLTTVSARASSRRARRTLAVSSSSPVALAKRLPKRSLRVFVMCSASSSSCMSRISLAFIALVLSQDELGSDGKLVSSQTYRFAGQWLRDACQLEHDTPRLDHGDPAFRVALARAHARLGRLLGDRLVGEDVYPDLPATLDLASHRDTSSLDLAVGEPPLLERLQAVLAELDLDLATREPAATATVLLAMLYALGGQHQR